MFNKDLLNFIKDNFAEDTKKIAESICDLHKSLENSINNVIDKSSELGKSRKFKEAELYLNKASELNEVSCKLNDYLNSFNNFITVNEIPYEMSLNECCCTLASENYISLSDILQNTNEKLLNKKIISFKVNNNELPAKNLKDILVNTLTFLGNKDKNKAYKLPQNTKLNKKEAVNFSFVKLKAMKDPVEIKDIGLFVETFHTNEKLVYLINAVLDQYSIPASELIIYLL